MCPVAALRVRRGRARLWWRRVDRVSKSRCTAISQPPFSPLLDREHHPADTTCLGTLRLALVSSLDRHGGPRLFCGDLFPPVRLPSRALTSVSVRDEKKPVLVEADPKPLSLARECAVDDVGPAGRAEGSFCTPSSRGDHESTSEAVAHPWAWGTYGGSGRLRVLALHETEVRRVGLWVWSGWESRWLAHMYESSRGPAVIEGQTRVPQLGLPALVYDDGSLPLPSRERGATASTSLTSPALSTPPREHDVHPLPLTLTRPRRSPYLCPSLSSCLHPRQGPPVLP